MTEDKQKSGQRFEIVVLKINRNNEGAVKELIVLQDMLKKHGEKFTILHSAYGAPAKALKKTIAWYLDSYSLAHPRKTLYEINKMFIERKLVESGDVADMGVQADIAKFMNALYSVFGKPSVRAEDIDDKD